MIRNAEHFRNKKKSKNQKQVLLHLQLRSQQVRLLELHFPYLKLVSALWNFPRGCWTLWGWGKVGRMVLTDHLSKHFKYIVSVHFNTSFQVTSQTSRTSKSNSYYGCSNSVKLSAPVPLLKMILTQPARAHALHRVINHPLNIHEIEL